MKSAFFVSGLLFFVVAVSSGQNPAADARKRLMERRGTGSTGNSVSPVQTKSQTVISYVTYLSKEREWSDVKGRKMTGRLVAFSAPEPGKEGPVVVLQEGKVRLRRTGAGASNDLPLDQLSQPDQVFVKSIDAAIKRQSEAKAKSE